jgi:hypothetical protein
MSGTSRDWNNTCVSREHIGMRQESCRIIRDHSDANPLLCWMFLPPWRAFLVQKCSQLSIRLSCCAESYTFRDSILH